MCVSASLRLCVKPCLQINAKPLRREDAKTHYQSMSLRFGRFVSLRFKLAPGKVSGQT
jgi:hypothetical protein